MYKIGDLVIHKFEQYNYDIGRYIYRITKIENDLFYICNANPYKVIASQIVHKSQILLANDKVLKH